MQNVRKTILTGRAKFSANYSHRKINILCAESISYSAKPFLQAEKICLRIYLQIVWEAILKNGTNLCANRSQNHYEF